MRKAETLRPQVWGRERIRLSPQQLPGLSVGDFDEAVEILVVCEDEVIIELLPMQKDHFVVTMGTRLSQRADPQSGLGFQEYKRLLEMAVDAVQEKVGDGVDVGVGVGDDEFTLTLFCIFDHAGTDLHEAYEEARDSTFEFLGEVDAWMQETGNRLTDTIEGLHIGGADYDVALSFAGDDREYVEQVAGILHELGIKVFYDRYEEADLWGKDLYTHLDDVYQNRARYCVLFISKDYKDKLWTNHERRSAQARAFREKGEYILPVRFDDTEIPGIAATTGYINLKDRSPQELAYLITKKLGLGLELEAMLEYLREELPGYSITMEGTVIVFRCEVEDYQMSFPARLLLEMYGVNMLDDMFLLPAIVPECAG